MTIFIQFLFILILVSGSGATAYVPHALLVVSDDEEEDLSVGRESRIEQLARKMMEKVDEEIAAKKVNDRKRHPSEPTPRWNKKDLFE